MKHSSTILIILVRVLQRNNKYNRQTDERGFIKIIGSCNYGGHKWDHRPPESWRTSEAGNMAWSKFKGLKIMGGDDLSKAECLRNWWATSTGPGVQMPKNLEF